MSKPNQAGKGDKYRTYSTETFADNYEQINWGHSNHKKHNGKKVNLDEEKKSVDVDSFEK